jgi:hypothetical protein
MILFADLLVIALLVCEFWWRPPWLRVLLVIFAVFQLNAATNLGPASRRAVAQPRTVTLPAPPSQPTVPASDFVSGVLVMHDEAKRDLTRITFPAGVLVWLALSPAVLEALSRHGFAVRKERGPGTSSAPGTG